MKTKFYADEINLLTLAKKYSNENKARKLFESWRWPGGKAICPHCKFDEAYVMKSKPGTKNKMRAGLYCCAACRKTFTATVGTVMEDSHLPISKWLMAMFLISSSKKGMSAHQVHRMLNITYKAAWFMCHRIRFAFGDTYSTYAAFDSFPNTMTPQVIFGTIGSTQQFMVELKNLTKIFTNMAISMNTNAIFRGTYPNQKAIFKYPSSDFLGELSDPVPEIPISKLALIIEWTVIGGGIFWMCVGWIFFQKRKD